MIKGMSMTWEQAQAEIDLFRKIFEEKKVPLLYLFIEKYSKSEIKALQSFANGLRRDIDAVENAVKQVLKDGYRTIDIMADGKTCVGTTEMGDLIAERI